jgi:uncharacterized repeat protein (TIGR04052 family)
MKTKLILLFATLVLLAGRAHAQGGIDVHGQCIGDADANGEVTIDELVAAVSNALEGCPQRAIALQFRPVVGDQDFVCGDVYEDMGATHSQLLAQDFRMYVSNVRLVTPQGAEVPLALDQTKSLQTDDVALLDFENGCGNGTPATNLEVIGTVPPGMYTGLRFTLGVPFALNHGNAATAPGPLAVEAMFWSWQGGYKFMRIDAVNPAIPPAGKTYRVHVGSTGCHGDPPREPVTACDRPNRAEVRFDAFDPDANVVVVDLRALFAGTDLVTVDPNDLAPGCMSDVLDADCDPVFANLGIDRNDGSADASKQTVFRVQ